MPQPFGWRATKPLSSSAPWRWSVVVFQVLSGFQSQRTQEFPAPCRLCSHVTGIPSNASARVMGINHTYPERRGHGLPLRLLWRPWLVAVLV
jgi:hypothetical protein